MKVITETEKAYIAGFIDGEGCISISKYQGKNNRTPVYSLQLVVAQKGPIPLFELHEITGLGTLQEGKKHRSGMFEWRINAIPAIELLMQILPYLRLKKLEAEIAIEYQSKQGHKNSTGKGYIVPNHLVEEKEFYYKRLQELKGLSGTNGGRGRPKKNQSGDSISV